MASQAATDFLTKEISISNNIVTFRLLSRQLSIHINDAKRELELFYEASRKSKTPVFATYLLTGISAPQINSAVGSTSSQAVSEDIPKRLVTLVTEDELEVTKGRFIDVPSQHIHSLSPVPLKDFGVLTSAVEQVRQLDKQKGQTHAARLGMLQSEEAPWEGAAVSKPAQKNTITERPITTSAASSKPAEKPQAVKPKVASVVAQDHAKQPVRQGALNFGALPKTKTVNHANNEDQSDSSKVKKNALKPTPSTATSKDAQQPSKMKVTPKSELPSLIDKGTSPTSNKTSAPKLATITSRTTTGRAKRVLHSSDEDEDEPAPTLKPPATKRQKSYATSEDEDEEHDSTSRRRSTSLQAMMDIDDDGVINGRSTREVTPEHVPSARELAAASKAAKAEAAKGVDQKARASRKRVPKGKKRIVKTRRVKNAKGYMVTEDYSSYEDDDSNNHNEATNSDVQSETDYGEDIDVDVNGRAVPAKPVPKAKPSTGAPAKRQQSESSGGTKKAKQNNTTKPGQPKLASFFGKK